MFGEGELFLLNPLACKAILFRVDPVKKKLLTTNKTKDGREVEVFLHICLKPKLAFIPEIFSHFGKNYSREFLETEVGVDIEAPISSRTFDELVGPPPAGDSAREEIINRIETAAAFYKLIVLDTKIIIRDPNAQD